MVVRELTNKWYDVWTVGVGEEELEKRIEGVVEGVLMACTLTYGVSGYAVKGHKKFNANFFAYDLGL